MLRSSTSLNVPAVLRDPGVAFLSYAKGAAATIDLFFFHKIITFFFRGMRRHLLSCFEGSMSKDCAINLFNDYRSMTVRAADLNHNIVFKHEKKIPSRLTVVDFHLPY